tara:strand:+ start:536 stop:664 length:129 start_codon:yes stop_codon:yes gene_type:complete
LLFDRGGRHGKIIPVASGPFLSHAITDAASQDSAVDIGIALG